jgi:hypothetical protein
MLETAVACRALAQDEVEQGDEGGSGAQQDQCVVGSQIVLHVKRVLDFRDHAHGLDQSKGALCEVVHIPQDFVLAGMMRFGSGFLARTGNGAAKSVLAIGTIRGERRAGMALAADRGHGTDRPARSASPAHRSLRVEGGTHPIGPVADGVSTGHHDVQPAQLVWRLRSAQCELRNLDSRCLLTRNSEPRPLASLQAAQPCFLPRDIVARHGNNSLTLGKLDLEIHHVLLPERHFR